LGNVFVGLYILIQNRCKSSLVLKHSESDTSFAIATGEVTMKNQATYAGLTMLSLLLSAGSHADADRLAVAFLTDFLTLLSSNGAWQIPSDD